MLHGLVGHLEPALHLRREAPSAGTGPPPRPRPGWPRSAPPPPAAPPARTPRWRGGWTSSWSSDDLVGGRQHRQLHPQRVPVLLRRLALAPRPCAARSRCRGELLLQQQGQPQRAGDDGDPLAIVDAGLRRLAPPRCGSPGPSTSIWISASSGRARADPAPPAPPAEAAEASVAESVCALSMERSMNESGAAHQCTLCLLALPTMRGA